MSANVRSLHASRIVCEKNIDFLYLFYYLSFCFTYRHFWLFLTLLIIFRNRLAKIKVGRTIHHSRGDVCGHHLTQAQNHIIRAAWQSRPQSSSLSRMTEGEKSSGEPWNRRLSHWFSRGTKNTHMIGSFK